MAKQHFVFLDGMRGVAALAVGVLHASQIAGLRFQPDNAHLAVDFFFCLSGFVLAYAYEARLRSGMAFTAFAEKRLIRLYPMILAGVLLGAAVSWLVHDLGSLQSGRTIATLAGASLALFPLGILLHSQAYPLNTPIWSLFFEGTRQSGLRRSGAAETVA